MRDDGLYPVPDDLGFAPTERGFVAGQKLFSRYTLTRIIGRGGMGLVWLAKDEELGEEIALKFLPEVVRLDATALEELRRETRRSRKLAHANIVKVYDFANDGSSAAISMEFVNGDTLSGLRARQENLHFEVREIEGWLKQLLNALIYAHEEARIVHRDLKPANIMVDHEGRVKVTDFGIASSISESVSRVTVQRGTSGTLAYMSPQQAMGMPPSVQDDVYALGSTIYELLTSKPPFSGSSQVAVLAQLREIVPPSMAQRRAELEIAGEPIPEAWEQTVAACLAKAPEQRPQSFAEVKERLWLRAPSPPPPPPTKLVTPTKGPEPSSPGPKNRRPLLIGAIVIAILLLGGLGYYYGVTVPYEKARQAEIDKQVADAQAAELTKEKAEAAAKADDEKAKEEAQRLANARSSMTVKTDPEGATVTLGTEDAQTSPATFKSEKLGSYQIHIALDGYEPVDQTAEIKENQTTDLGTIALTRSKGSIQIATDSAGLDYSISQNGTVMNTGKTPATVPDLPTGNYDVSVRKGDWEIKNTVTVQRNQTASYAPDFATGSVALTSAPPGASVMLGEKEMGQTPLTLSNLRPGAVSYTLKLKGYKAASTAATVTANQQVALSATLEKSEAPPPSAFIGKFAGTWTGVFEDDSYSITINPDGTSYTESVDDGAFHCKGPVQISGDTLSFVQPWINQANLKRPCTLVLDADDKTARFTLLGLPQYPAPKTAIFQKTTSQQEILKEPPSDFKKKFAGTWIGKDDQGTYTLTINSDETGYVIDIEHTDLASHGPVQISDNTLSFVWSYFSHEYPCKLVLRADGKTASATCSGTPPDAPFDTVIFQKQ